MRQFGKFIFKVLSRGDHEIGDKSLLDHPYATSLAQTFTTTYLGSYTGLLPVTLKTELSFLPSSHKTKIYFEKRQYHQSRAQRF